MNLKPHNLILAVNSIIAFLIIVLLSFFIQNESINPNLLIQNDNINEIGHNNSNQKVSYLIPESKTEINGVIEKKTFKESETSTINFARSTKEAWLKLSFNSNNNNDLLLHFNQLYIDSIQLYLVKNNTVIYKSGYTGISFLKKKQIKYLKNNSYSFPFSVSTGDYQLYLKLNSRFSPLRTKLKLWKENDFNSRSIPIFEGKFLLILIFGFVLFASVIVLIFFFLTFEKIYIYYILFMFINLSTYAVARGYSSSILPFLNFQEYDIRGIFMLLFVIFTSLYFGNLISKTYRKNWIQLLFKATSIACVVIFIISLLIPNNILVYRIMTPIVQISIFLTYLLPLIYFIQGARKNHFLSKVYLLGYSILLFGGIRYILITLNIIDYTYSSPFWGVGICFELMIFTFAFAYHYYETQNKKMELLSQINENRNEYLNRYYLSQENERKRISSKIHDGIIQQLVSINHEISASNILEKGELLENLNETTEELRSLSHHFMPKVLLKIGVEKAINELLETSLKQTSLVYKYEYYGIINRIPEKIELNIYRITQELTQNVIKHSKATQIDVQLYQIENNIHLIYEDNGIGLIENSENGGIGIKSIKSRVESQNGTMNIDSTQNKNCIFTIKIPL